MGRGSAAERIWRGSWPGPVDRGSDVGSRLRRLFLTDSGGLTTVGLAAILLALGVAGGAVGYYMWKGADLGGGMPQLESARKCYECGYVGTVKLQVGQFRPTCPKCGKDAFLAAYKCPKCGNLEVLNEERGLPPPTKCSRCGGEIRHGG